MTPSQPITSSPASGFLLLRLAVLLLIVAGVAAGFTSWRLWQRSTTITEQSTPHVPPLTNDDNSILLPNFTVDPKLAAAEAELTQRLFIPMRNFYATREERLGDVAVTTSTDEEHTTIVTVSLSENGQSRQVTFFFDRQGDDRDGDFRPWSLSDFDNEVPLTSSDN